MSPPLTIDDRIKIIDEIEVLDTAVVVSSQGPVYAEGQDSASVDAGSSLSFVGNITGQMKVFTILLLYSLCCTNPSLTSGRRVELDPLRPAGREQEARPPERDHRVVQLLQVCLGDRRLEHSELRVRWHASSSETEPR